MSNFLGRALLWWARVGGSRETRNAERRIERARAIRERRVEWALMELERLKLDVRALVTTTDEDQRTDWDARIERVQAALVWPPEA